MDNFGRQRLDCIIKQIQSGNQKDINQLYSIISNPIKYIALKYLHNKEDAEDLLQDFWCNICKVIENYHYNQNFYGYVCKVVKNMSINRFKDLHRHSVVGIDCVNCGEIFRHSEMFDADIEIAIMIEQALGKLLPAQRTVIKTVFFERKTIREIAVDMQLSKSEVQRQKLLALKRLKALLQD